MKIGEKNVGSLDRVVRIVLGLALLFAGARYLAGLLSYVVMLVGIALVLTGLLGTCTLYSLLGINTAGKK